MLDSQTSRAIQATVNHTWSAAAAAVYRQAAPFARLAGSDAAQLGITLGLAEKALQLQPDNVNMVRMYCLQGNTSSSQHSLHLCLPVNLYVRNLYHNLYVRNLYHND